MIIDLILEPGGILQRTEIIAPLCGDRDLIVGVSSVREISVGHIAGPIFVTDEQPTSQAQSLPPQRNLGMLYPSWCLGGSMKAGYPGIAILAILLCCYSHKSQAQLNEMQSDRAHRDKSIKWPAAYDPSVAPVFSHNELLIHADCEHTFDRLADVTHWPDWLVLVKEVSNETPGLTNKGALYRLRIFNSPIQSRIVEFAAGQRISWVPFGADETETRHGHYHTWRFVPQAANCQVITEETGIGPGDLKDPAAGSHLMHKAHELWLNSLKFISEP